MGLAASQARYLSLSARKSNVEYEGQQINQQRLNLSNQSADLFNQMLTMAVPMPPSSTDFTKLQYSWTDGDVASVIENYYQIGTIDDEFNYVVTSYHYENVYTGQRKFLPDPQVQATKTNHFSDLKARNFVLQEMSYNPEKDTYSLQLINGFDQLIHATYKLCDAVENRDTVEQLDYMFNRTTKVGYSSSMETDFVYDDAADTITYNGSTYSYVDTENDAAKLRELCQSYGAFYNSAKRYYSNGTNYICKDDLDTVITNKNGDVDIRKKDTKKYYTDGTRYIAEDSLRNLSVGDTMTTYQAENNPTFSDYKSIGNCEIKQLTEDDYKGDVTIDIAIQQIIKDMKANDGDAIAYERLKNCFDENGKYISGTLYQFTMAGKMYYTTAADMDASLLSAYSEQSVANNSIDSQQSKLSYYNAVYINTKVSEIKKAMMETDGAGRFSTVKFEDDSVVYTLNVETIKDDDAYNDAMNKYYYEKEQYDKQIADINTKTEIIQAQDRQLQLKLEQLGTEQSALQTEMEACQKVVSKNIDNSFKTFGN